MTTWTPKTKDEVKSEVFDFLQGTQYASTSLDPVLGGASNFIYKATLSKPRQDGPTEVLIKHGEGYMAVAPENKISIDRCKVETECLRELAGYRVIQDQSDPFQYIVRTPKSYFFDDTTKSQVLEYLPNGINLKAYILQNFPSPTPVSFRPQCHQLGKSLGQYITGFTHKKNPNLLKVIKKNTEMQGLKHMINFDWLLERVEDVLGSTRDVFVEVKQHALDDLKVAPKNLWPIHGDLHPGNIVLPNLPIVEGVEVPIFVIDWEQTQLGMPSLDHGELIAEFYSFWLYKKIDAGLWMLQGYSEGLGEQTEEEVWRNIVQAGVHLLSFSTVGGWGTQEQIVEVARLARDIILNAWAKNREWFEKNELSCLLRGPSGRRLCMKR